MTSLNMAHQEVDDNLIDLDVIPSELPICVKLSAEVSDSLMDTELPVLEQKLQNTPEHHVSKYNSPIDTVNIEEILISLDEDECYNDTNSNKTFFNEEDTSQTSSVCCEAINILTKLDELLNESLRSSNALLDQIGDLTQDSESQLKLDESDFVEEPSTSSYTNAYISSLAEAPEIPENFDYSRSEVVTPEGNTSSTLTLTDFESDEAVSLKNDSEKLTGIDDKELGRIFGSNDIAIADSVGQGNLMLERSETNERCEEIQRKQSNENSSEQFEKESADESPMTIKQGDNDSEVFGKNVCVSGLNGQDPNGNVCEVKDTKICEELETKEVKTICVNICSTQAGERMKNVELPVQDSRTNLKRALSNCGGDRGNNFKRNNRWRVTMGSPNDIQPTTTPHHSFVQFNLSRDRKLAPGVESDEEIDWSWVKDVENERRAHAVGEIGTGSVTVEPLQRETPGFEIDNQRVASDIGHEEEVPESAWLRSSMRRIEHLRMPSEIIRINIPDTPIPSAPPLESQELLHNCVPGSLESARYLDQNVRPVSAPSRLGTQTSVATQSSTRETRSRSRESRRHSEVETVYRERARSSSASSRSRRLRSLSSSESSLASSIESTPGTDSQPGPGIGIRRPCERPRYSDMPVRNSPIGHWPHSMSSMLACLGCTIGLFNISRFAILSVQFGANFILQFLILSVLIGLPLFTLQLCLGQQLGAGVIDMWRISPLFQGVGIALLTSQALIGLYSVVGISWMFVFFRDSFITKTDRYRWAEPFFYYRDDINHLINGTYKLTETVPDYFSGVVLQRHHLAAGSAFCTIKFQLAFNLAVVWMIVFVSLSKGLRSYGKVIYVFVLFPVFGMFVVCAKMLAITPVDIIYAVFPETTWNEFFINSKSWIAACQEVFLTWGLLGASAMQIASHNKNKHILQRDSCLIALITFTILLLSAFLANTCVQLLNSFGYRYIPDSFERISTYGFLRSVKDPLPANLANTPVRYMFHQSFIVGERIIRPGTDHTSESGYQALRFASELIPTTFAVIGPSQLSPFWAVLFYFTLILFGITQQLAIWHCVITGIMAIKTKVLRSWETTITFFSCACGFILGLPMATELGIYVIYFFDFVVGGQWWMMLIILIQILAVFMVRGRPYSGDALVNALFTNPSRPCLLTWAPALLSFTWNVILPVALMVWCIIFFKNGNFRELFIWHHIPSYEYWPLWARQLGSMIQLLHVLCVPLVAVIQSYRYLNKGPDDILDRVQLLYRPPIGEHMEAFTIQENTNVTSTAAAPTQISTTVTEDPPPKYTPPPSYTTATGARIAKFLRQSIRRSMRRIANVIGESSRSNHRQTETVSNSLPPPDYNDVLDEISHSRNNNSVSVNVIDLPESGGTRNGTIRNGLGVNLPPGVALSAADVACILRNSFRRSARRAMNYFRREGNENRESVSAENLVDSVAPIGHTSVNLENFSNSSHEVKPASENSSSVI